MDASLEGCREERSVGWQTHQVEYRGLEGGADGRSTCREREGLGSREAMVGCI